MPSETPSFPSPALLFLSTTFSVGVALFLVGNLAEVDWLRLAAKPIPVLALIAWVLRDARSPLGRVTAAALVLGVTGDILLELGSATFLAGLVAFLLGHVAYIIAFSRDAPRLAPLQAIPMLGYGVIAAVVLWPTLGGMAAPVGAYMLVISAMAWRAAAFAEARRGLAWLAPIGAILFLFSDSLIAIDRFIDGIDASRPAIILTYWLGQLGLAAGVVLSRRAGEAGPA